MFQKCKSGNKELVSGSFLTIIGFIPVSVVVGFFGLFFSISSACKAFNDIKTLTLFVCI